MRRLLSAKPIPDMDGGQGDWMLCYNPLTLRHRLICYPSRSQWFGIHHVHEKNGRRLHNLFRPVLVKVLPGSLQREGFIDFRKIVGAGYTITALGLRFQGARYVRTYITFGVTHWHVPVSKGLAIIFTASWSSWKSWRLALIRTNQRRSSTNSKSSDVVVVFLDLRILSSTLDSDSVGRSRRN